MVNFIIQQPFYFHWGTLQRIQRTERWDLVAGHLNQQQLLHLHPSRNTSLCSGWTQIRFLFVFTVWWKERSEGVGGARPPEESERAKQVGGRRSDRNLKPDSSSVCLSGGFQNKASWLTVTVFFFSFFSTTLRDRTASVQIWVICAARMRRWSQSKSGGVGRSRVQFVSFLYHRMCVRVVLYQCSELSRRWPWWRLVIVSGSGELFVSLLCLFRYSWGCHTLRCRTGRLELFL